MSTLVAVDGVLYDLESSPDAPDGVSALVGEPEREDEGGRDPELSGQQVPAARQ